VTISIANRILLGFAVIVALMVGLGIYAINQLDDVRQSTETIVTRDLSLMRQLEDVSERQNTMRGLREEILSRFFLRSLGQQQGAVDDLARSWEQQAAATEASLEQTLATVNGFAANSVTSQRADAWRRIIESLNRAGSDLRQLRSTSERQFAALQTNDLAAVAASQSALNGSRESWSRNLAQSRSILSEAITIGQRRIGEVYEQSRMSIILALAGAAILSVVITYALRSSITGPLGTFMGFVERVGRGELGGQMAVTGKDEIGHLGTTLNTMVDGLRQRRSAPRHRSRQPPWKSSLPPCRKLPPPWTRSPIRARRSASAPRRSSPRRRRPRRPAFPACRPWRKRPAPWIPFANRRKRWQRTSWP